ncbi:Prefoldin subunit 2 [Trichoplax sp. H2]|uniref:Prefoldin subunit 2 n=1 Tax=Trichoplax adhaerens TaxID=10228 RepID=B3RIW4_TRIAD|nr:hypothetical protein TRIADDRAFT_19142 [Trichoplax adhaerens]EDV29262.1 hypothetical protein TRIADDRAFT_19142 [Trichoplax adhaerens]RDD38454.1 Prefoldin subunit 2 [Trichoplax sp. H2]|eukprot:XP_002108464.1 hypothetical protein TRIADDRAFT_19142 [Trichoplax adhaerens]
MATGKKTKTLYTQDQVVAQFNHLRQEQRAIASKIGELELEKNEHKIVIDTLQEVDAKRKCFRLIGGILVERTAGEVLPALQHNQEQIIKATEKLKERLGTKGEEINQFRQKYNIKVRGERESNQEESKETKSSGQGILVAGKD